MDAKRVHKAFKNGDLETLRSASDDVSGFPNCKAPLMSGHCLEYAIYHSPFAFIQTLVGMGADPNYNDHGGFPSIIAALSTDRQDKCEVIKLLIASGADINQRGVNDWTPLHYAAAQNDPRAIELLISNGADLNARTRIDDLSTPLEEAVKLNCSEAVKILKRLSI